MSVYKQKPTKEFTYRVHIDDDRAMRKVNRLQSLDSGYDITKIPKQKVPNGNAVKHWNYVFYRSKEIRDLHGNVTGGTIPGFHKYRYSLEWERTPESELLEMRHANVGGTRIKGEAFVGTHDPRISDYVEVNTVVPWTPKEIKEMFNGEKVPDKVNYSYDPPMIEAKEAREEYRKIIEQAKDDGFRKAMADLHEFMENCDHDHVVLTGREYGDVAYCEDCGKQWDSDEFEHEKENDELTVVGYF